MLTLPLPMFVSLVLGFLCVRHALAGDRSLMFLLLLAACAGQALMISLAQHYGLGAALMIQPFTASIIPPLAWLTFRASSLRKIELKVDWVHLLGPCAILVAIWTFAPALDVGLLALFVGYGSAILLRLRAGGTLPFARLQSGPVPVRIWRGVGMLLILSALSDILIVAAIILGAVELRPLIISVFTSFTLLGVGLLSLSRDADTPQTDEVLTDTAAPLPSTEDQELVSRLDALMAQERLFLDPDLTLSRLAKRMHVPIKHLSAAINRTKSQNVSRYVNDFRIRAACEQLAQGETVTEAMFGSGFNTKSNFNREFLRVTGQTPTQYADTLKA